MSPFQLSTTNLLTGLGIYMAVALTAALFRISQDTIRENVYIEVKDGVETNGREKT